MRKINPQLRYFFTLIMSIISVGLHSQTTTPTIFSPEAQISYNRAKTETSLHTGLVNTNIPLYEINLKNFSFPIYNSYTASGNKVNTRPSYVGLGWNLVAGGSINVNRRGLKDEYSTFYEYEDRTKGNNWDSESNLRKYTTARIDNPDYGYEPNLDCFNISIGDINASFYMYRESSGEIATKIISKNSKPFKVIEVNIADIPDMEIYRTSYIFKGQTREATQVVKFWKSITKIVILDNEGIKYTFGGSETSNEFSSCFRYFQGNRFLDANINTWNITKIETPNNEFINFNYDQDIIYFYDSYVKADGIPTYNKYYVHPSILSNIVSSNGDNISFHFTKRNDLSNVRLDIINDPKYYEDRKDIPMDVIDRAAIDKYCMYDKTHYLKLDSLNTNKNISIIFNYIENSSERLKLKQIGFKEFCSKNIEYKYEFNYNPLLLPSEIIKIGDRTEDNNLFNRKETDNWGYFNGKEYFQINSYNSDLLFDYRQSDSIKIKAEILESIIHPTGNQTFFKYELNDYSKIATIHPIGIIKEYGKGGGLRIKEIREVPSDSDKEVIKTYIYKNVDNTSSGILSNKPKYSEESTNLKGEPVNRKYYVENVNWQDGPDIIYGRVIEQYGHKGGYKVYNFSTHLDFNNEAPLARLFNTNMFSFVENGYSLISNAIHRGLLMSLEYYDNQNNMKKKEEYKYNINYDNYLRIIHHRQYAYTGDVATALKIYTNHPYLKERKIVDFLTTSSSTSIYTYTYNSQRSLNTETFQYNNERTLEKQYKYATDFLEPNKLFDPYSVLLRNNILSEPIESVTLLDNKEIHRVKNNYETKSVLLKPGKPALYGSIALPSNIEESFSGANNLQVVESYLDFDDKRNPIECINKEGLKVFYFWNNEGKLIAEIKNVTRENLLGALNGSWISSDFDTRLANLRTSEKLKNALITTYTYKPLIGMTTMTDPRGVTTTYEYDSFGRLAKVKDANGKIINSYNYHYQNQ